MRKYPLVFLLAVALLIPANTQAGFHTYVPDPADLYGLDHWYYYTWGIDLNLSGETVTEVVLKIDGIYDWRYEDNDILYVHMLDDAPLGVTMTRDDQNPVDAFAGQGYLVGTWTDPYGEPAYRQNISWSLSAEGLIDEFNAFASNDDIIAFAFDPDCHYWNDGLTLEVTTEPIPEPGTLALFGLGLAGAATAVRRRRAQRE